MARRHKILANVVGVLCYCLNESTIVSVLMWETEEGTESNREENGEYDDHDDQYVLLHCQVKGT